MGTGRPRSATGGVPTLPSPARGRRRPRLGGGRPAWRPEVRLLAVLFLAYEAVRLGASDALGPAVGHARGVLDVERHLGLDVEAWLNRGLVRVRGLEVVASFWYASLHYLVTPLVLVLLYRRHPRQYRPARTALVLATGSALIGYLAFPTAPPRLLPGYTDVLRETADVGWWSDAGSAVRGAASAVNDLAAMPSMHVGWALWCGLVLAALARNRVHRALALSYPLITTTVVVATANHWVLDAVAGAALVGLAWYATHVLAGPLHAPTDPPELASIPSPRPAEDSPARPRGHREPQRRGSLRSG